MTSATPSSATIHLPPWVDIDHRDNLGRWLNQRGLVGAGAEIGIAFCGWSRIVLSTWLGKRYYLVDPLVAQDPAIYREKHDDVDWAMRLRDAIRLTQDDPRAVLIQKFSVDAAKDIEDGSLDWIFLDGNHSLRAVLDDMDAWWPKVKIGGVFGGHDYGDDTNYPSWVEVKSAVDRWCHEHRITFTLSRCVSWWVLKQ